MPLSISMLLEFMESSDIYEFTKSVREVHSAQSVNSEGIRHCQRSSPRGEDGGASDLSCHRGRGHVDDDIWMNSVVKKKEDGRKIAFCVADKIMRSCFSGRRRRRRRQQQQRRRAKWRDGRRRDDEITTEAIVTAAESGITRISLYVGINWSS